MVQSLIPLSEYSHRETELMLKKWNGRIARTSFQLIDFLSELEPLNDEMLQSKLPILDEKGDWVSTFKLNNTYKLGSLYKNSSTLPTPMYVEYANNIRFVPAVYVDNRSEKTYFRCRKVDLGETQEDIKHDCIFLYGGLDLELKPREVNLQHIPALEYPYHIEQFSIADWDYAVILPLFYKEKFYLMVLPECDAAKEDPKLYIHEEARLKWQKMIENELTDRLFYTFQ
jgi:hypothetical protein